MRIARHEFDPALNSLNVYVSGCKGRACKGCHNPELWDFGVGPSWLAVRDDLAKKINTIPASRVFIWGGEPLDQPEGELLSMLSMFRNMGLEVWLFTGKTMEEVPKSVLSASDYVKFGEYVEGLPSKDTEFGITLASSNQSIVCVSPQGCSEWQ